VEELEFMVEEGSVLELVPAASTMPALPIVSAITEAVVKMRRFMRRLHFRRTKTDSCAPSDNRSMRASFPIDRKGGGGEERFARRAIGAPPSLGVWSRRAAAPILPGEEARAMIK